MAGIFGHSPSTFTRERLVVISPKCDMEQMAMQISHSVHKERLILNILSSVKELCKAGCTFVD
jgi:hypothetical protein